MPMMFGFSEQRRRLLDEEVERLAAELPPLGVERLYVTGDLARGRVGPASELDLVLVQRTEEPFHRRPDFFVTHLRPRVAIRFTVYTPEEFSELAGDDPVLLDALRSGEAVFGG